jgi:hypothetical protein
VSQPHSWRARLDRLISSGDIVLLWWGWPLVALVIGVVPVWLGVIFHFAFHQLLTAMLTGWLLVAAVRRDDQLRALGLVLLVFAAHSAVVILASAQDAGTARVLPQADAYWQKTWLWVSQGIDTEYHWQNWISTHGLLLLLVPIAAYTSFGLLPLWQGFEQLDLMNYYVGRLIAMSESPWKAVLFGWHPWSLLRGLAFLCLIFEASSLSVERLLGRPISTRKRRCWRWGVGLTLAVADMSVKYWFSPLIREQLMMNLSAESSTA